jgi:penicillin-binding protein 1A
MPVEIWSRFMRGAHQGVPVASLPGSGSAGGGLFSGLFGGGGNAAPAPQPASTVGQAPPVRDGASLDGYLLNNLFGRR